MRSHTLSRWTARTAIVLLSGGAITACSGDESTPITSTPADVDSTQAASVKIAIAIDLDQDDATTAAKIKGGSSFGQDGFGADTSAADVKSMKLDVLDAATNKYFSKGIGFLESSPGVWEITLPFLPKITTLTFVAHAFDIAGIELFTGSITQSVPGNNTTVTIPLSPTNDGATVDLPAIRKITIPQEFVAGQTNNITFAIRGLAGDDIDYTIDGQPGGGTFSPRPAGSSFTISTARSSPSMTRPP